MLAKDLAQYLLSVPNAVVLAFDPDLMKFAPVTGLTYDESTVHLFTDDMQG